MTSSDPVEAAREAVLAIPERTKYNAHGVGRPPRAVLADALDAFEAAIRAESAGTLDYWQTRAEEAERSLGECLLRAESAGTHRMNSATLKCVVDGETWPCLKARAESAGTGLGELRALRKDPANSGYTAAFTAGWNDAIDTALARLSSSDTE